MLTEIYQEVTLVLNLFGKVLTLSLKKATKNNAKQVDSNKELIDGV